MSDLPFIKFFPSDFLGGTSGLSPAERGVYITILCLIWEAEGPVALDDARLARRCGMPKAAFKRTLQALLDDGKLERVEGGLMNDRAKKTLVDRQNRSRNATHAANSRWTEQEGKIEEKQSHNDAGAMQAQCVGDAIPEARSQKPDEGIVRSSITRFQEFWDLYPHRGGTKRNRKGAEDKYRAAVKRGVSEREIIDGVTRAKRDPVVRDGFARDPVTWLNQSGWEDEISEQPPLKVVHSQQRNGPKPVWQQVNERYEAKMN